ncbi:MAG: polysaccharide biosynthesis/export family protein [Micavibrio aeruginosavorus]|uniref:Polysaccharide biosynthesis/export family protein n=1 Tax=Micavibrio aeruginosavorus TaxID=349221 RepID=A0A2W5BTN5_9BACT|nr:MAG: polysaccharide biosynthesis/export family protein [Micavibrio aeruginosavorus]
MYSCSHYIYFFDGIRMHSFKKITAICILTAFIALSPLPSVANDAFLADEEAPESAAIDDDVDPKPLTLADLERLTGGGLSGLNLEQDSQSPIEKMYSVRADEKLTLFGHDLFQKGKKASTSLPTGTVRDDYVLGVGDTLDINIRGQENAKKSYTIDTEGYLVPDNFNRIAAAGMTLSALRQTLAEEASRLHNVDIAVSLSAPRQIDILVIGDVYSPGRKTLTSYHSILDALQEADGVKKTGSLRRIKIVRGGKGEFVDLYSVMMQGTSNADKRLRDGDRIIVPPIGPTVAVTGAVKRPAIYEIRKGDTLSSLEMLGLAGGVVSPGSNRFLQLSLTNEGKEIVETVSEPAKKSFGDGSILRVAQAQEKRSQNIELSGQTRDPGQYDLHKAQTLSDLIGSEDRLGDNLYPLIGVVARKDKSSLTTNLIEFSPRAVLAKKDNMDLREGDSVHLFSFGQIRALSRKVSDEPLLKKTSYGDSATGKDRIEDEEIASFLEERCVFVRGSVRQQGAYPVAHNTPVKDIIAVAGGMTVEADKNDIEVTTDDAHQRINTGIKNDGYSSIRVSAGDTIRVNQKFNRVAEQSVVLTGEVKNPGKYDVKRGDTLLSLIKRAGGLSDTAYPDGIIFSRASERKQEENRYRAQARDLEMKLADMMRMEDKDKKPDMAQVNTAQALIAQLKDAKAVGRITVQADPSILAADPEQDILLESGDRIYIPRRPLTVRVGGEVLSPAALQFRKGKGADDYIDEAGGTTYFADSDRAFVVYPNGSAKPLAVSAWKQGITMIPPGSTIIVPRDPKPFNFLEGAETITTILANIALTGFYLNDLGDDD